MNKVGQYRLFMSIGLAILITLLGIALLRITKESVIWIVFSMIVLMAMVGVAVNYMSIKRLTSKLEKLPETYKTVYLDAQEAIGLSAMTKQQKKETNEMILEIFEHAALDQRDVNDVIDNNLQEFINQFITVSGGQPSLLYLFSYSSFMFMIYLLFMKLYKVVRPGFDMENFKSETLDLGITLTYALIAFVFFPWLMVVLKKASSERWDSKKRLLILIPFIIPIGLMAFLILIRVPEVVDMLDVSLPIFSSVYLFLAGILLTFVFYIVMKYAQRQQQRKSLE